MENKITRFEHDIRKENLTLSVTDLWALNSINKSEHPILSAEESKEARDLIKEKQVHPANLSYYYWSEKRGGHKNYNKHVKAVWMCLSKSQWELIFRYYRGWYNETEEDDI